MKNLHKNISLMWGSKGTDWLNNLPAIISQLSQQWQLHTIRPVQNLTINYLAYGITQTNNRVIIKVCFDEISWHHETMCLNFFAGNGSVKLLASDKHLKAMLLEAAIPGHSLTTLFSHNDKDATLTAAHVIKKLHVHNNAPLIPLPSLHDLTKILYNDEVINVLPQKHILRAQAISTELLASDSKQIVLHGDLHHDNILSAHRDLWLAIDPHGIIGEAAYEPSAFIRNPLISSLTKQMIAQRLDIFSYELQLDRKQIKDWAYVHTLLSACWSVSDNLNPQHSLQVAELINALD